MFRVAYHYDGHPLSNTPAGWNVLAREYETADRARAKCILMAVTHGEAAIVDCNGDIVESYNGADAIIQDA